MLKASDFLSPDKGYLALPRGDSVPFSKARAIIVPFGLEASVSYESGTARGPAAILAASAQQELFDEEMWCEPFRHYGVATFKPPKIKKGVKPALDQLAGIIAPLVKAGKFPLTLGGEHSLTAGAIRPFAEKFKKLTILQIDAHADLRDGYAGEHYSHAAAMRRCLDFPNVRLVSLGIRNVSASEIPFIEDNPKRVQIFWAKDKARWRLSDILSAIGTDPVYLTVDIDGFDSSLIPATGTPEPGGLFWDETLAILRAAAQKTSIVGADIVELSPRAGLHACDFLASKLCYKILTYSLLPKSQWMPKAGQK